MACRTAIAARSTQTAATRKRSPPSCGRSPPTWSPDGGARARALDSDAGLEDRPGRGGPGADDSASTGQDQPAQRQRQPDRYDGQSGESAPGQREQQAKQATADEGELVRSEEHTSELQS